ncbi:hypothetical protein [Parasphingorhabdus sp.]|uniref:hypothetical protein n=1 Tax=Parasphingorhabdus sp. TaxID=2709688 RepID=UPI0030034781
MFENMKKIRQKSFAASLFLSTSIVTLAASSPALAQDGYSQDQTSFSFAGSGYSYCDAKLVGAVYGWDAGDGKTFIGASILYDDGEQIPSLLAESRQLGNTCSFADSGYGYDDAERISDLWNLGDVGRAKSKIANMVTDGERDQIIEALGY